MLSVCGQITKTVDKRQPTNPLFTKMNTQLRHISVPRKTTVRLETVFWEQLESLAKQDAVPWRKWVELVLADKPCGIGCASWLRVNCLLGIKELYGEKIIRTC